MFNVINLQANVDAHKVKTERIMQSDWSNHLEPHTNKVSNLLGIARKMVSFSTKSKPTFNGSACCVQCC
jgi:hypothetical protein